MSIEDYVQIRVDHPRIQQAIAELKELILARYPSAQFKVVKGYEPAGVYLRVIIEGADLEEVWDVYRDRELDFQVEDEMPLYVLTEVIPAQAPIPAAVESEPGQVGAAAASAHA